MSVSDIRMLDPLTEPRWNEWLANTPGATFFHTSGWARTLAESYGFKPFYVGVVEKDRFALLMAVMEARSLLKGRRGVSLPFSDYCEPLYDTPELLAAGTELLAGKIRERGWRYLEFRSVAEIPAENQITDHFYLHVLTMDKDITDAEYLRSFRGSTKTNINKAIKSGIRVESAVDGPFLDVYYDLHCQTRKLHGVPPQPKAFFESFRRNILEPGLGRVYLAFFEDTPVAGNVFVNFGDLVCNKFGALNRDFQQYRPSNLITWQAILDYTAQGYGKLCFGRTEVDNPGLIQYKEGWRAERKQLIYRRLGVAEQQQVAGRAGGFFTTANAEKFCGRMPMWLFKLVGRVLYPQMD